MVVSSVLVPGATTALSTGRSRYVSGYVAAILKAGLAYLPAELVIAGIAVALYGLLPRAFAHAGATFAAATFIGLLGSGRQLPQWVLDLSPSPTSATHPKATSTPPTLPRWSWLHSH